MPTGMSYPKMREAVYFTKGHLIRGKLVIRGKATCDDYILSYLA